MAIDLKIANIFLSAESKKSFKDYVKNDEKDFRDYFNANMWEMANNYDKIYTWEVWKELGIIPNSLADFEKILETAPRPSSKGTTKIKDTANAQEWFDIYFPVEKRLTGMSFGSEVWSIPRKEIISLVINDEGVIKITEKNKKTSLYDSISGRYTGLRGDLDLSECENLEELNISRNPFLGQVNISQCLRLKSIFINSDPHRAISHGEQMNVNNLIVANDYPFMNVFMSFASIQSKTTWQKLMSNGNITIFSQNGSSISYWIPRYNLIKWIKEEADASGNITRSWEFYAEPKSQLYYEMIKMFQVFESSTSNHDFNLCRDYYQDLIDKIGGRGFGSVVFKSDALGNPLFFELDNTTPKFVLCGDFAFATLLNKILNPPLPEVLSWASFREYVKKLFLASDDTVITANYKKYFEGVDEVKIEEFIDKLGETLRATIDVNKPDRDQFYLFPSDVKKIKRTIRGNVEELEFQVPKDVDKKKRFKEILPFESFKIGRII